jgi:hypothetical protein
VHRQGPLPEEDQVLGIMTASDRESSMPSPPRSQDHLSHASRTTGKFTRGPELRLGDDVALPVAAYQFEGDGLFALTCLRELHRAGQRSRALLRESGHDDLPTLLREGDN